MSTTATVAVITLSSLSVVLSATTLAVVIVGGKRAHDEIQTVKTQVNRSLKKAKAAISELEF